MLVEQLAKVGIRVKLEQIEWGQWLDRVYKNADYDMTIIGHAEAWDAGNYANPKYYYRYDSPRFQAVFQESETTLDDKKRRELYVAAPEDHGRRGAGRLALRRTRAWWRPRRASRASGRTCPRPSMDLSEVGWAK